MPDAHEVLPDLTKKTLSKAVAAACRYPRGVLSSSAHDMVLLLEVLRRVRMLSLYNGVRR